MSVSVVVAFGSKKQVLGVAAWRVVALVQYTHSFWNGSMLQAIHFPMDVAIPLPKEQPAVWPERRLLSRKLPLPASGFVVNFDAAHDS
jgi:hypothetical protein